MNTEAVRADCKRRSSTVWARATALSLSLAGALCWLGYSIGRGALGGNETDGGQGASVYLFEEPVERAGYLNHWWAYRGRREGGTEVEITVVGEGKLVEFRGTLSPDVEARDLCWHGAQNFGQGIDIAEIERLVPEQAIANLWAWNSPR